MTAPDAAATHAGLADLFSYPVAACIQDRRTRRVLVTSQNHGFAVRPAR